MTGRRVVPLPGPIEQDPTGELGRTGEALFPDRRNPAQVLAEAMLDVALEGIELGAYDTRIVAWLKGRDQPTVGAVASLLRRAFEAGLAAGRAELVDERPLVEQLRATIAALVTDLQAAQAEREEAEDELRAATDRRGAPLGDVEPLGDGLWASTDGWMFALTADPGSPGERTVYVEPATYAALARWAKAHAQDGDPADDAVNEARALARRLDAARATLTQVNGWWRDALAERDETRQDVEDLTEDRDALAGERDRLRSQLADLAVAAREIEARFDTERMSAQGAFERLLGRVLGTVEGTAGGGC